MLYTLLNVPSEYGRLLMALTWCRAFRTLHGGPLQSINIKMDAALVQVTIFVVYESARCAPEENCTHLTRKTLQPPPVERAKLWLKGPLAMAEDMGLKLKHFRSGGKRLTPEDLIHSLVD